MVLEDGVVLRRDDACRLGRARQPDVVKLHLLTEEQPPFFLGRSVGQLLPTGLDGEVCLAEGHDLLRRVGVLDDEIASVAREQDGLQSALAAAADGDHFGDINEMVLDPLAAVETGGLGSLHRLFEIAVVRVAEDLGKVAAGPVFGSGRVGTPDSLEW